MIADFTLHAEPAVIIRPKLGMIYAACGTKTKCRYVPIEKVAFASRNMFNRTVTLPIYVSFSAWRDTRFKKY